LLLNVTVFLRKPVSTYLSAIGSWALSYLDTAKVSIVANLQPIVAAFLGWIVLGEVVSGQFFIGTFLVCWGVLITQKG
jgi:drug/metabolite transporter (DMT)-like permease